MVSICGGSVCPLVDTFYETFGNSISTIATFDRGDYQRFGWSAILQILDERVFVSKLGYHGEIALHALLTDVHNRTLWSLSLSDDLCIRDGRTRPIKLFIAHLDRTRGIKGDLEVVR